MLDYTLNFREILKEKILVILWIEVMGGNMTRKNFERFRRLNPLEPE